MISIDIEYIQFRCQSAVMDKNSSKNTWNSTFWCVSKIYLFIFAHGFLFTIVPEVLEQYGGVPEQYGGVPKQYGGVPEQWGVRIFTM